MTKMRDPTCGTLTQDDPRTEDVGEGSRGRNFSPHPPCVLARGETKVCQLLTSVVPSVDAEMIPVPTENESFVRGLSKR